MFKKILLKFTGFSFVGLITTVISLFLIYIFIGMLRTPLYLSYIIIYIVTIYVSYYINTTIVFKADIAFKKCIKYFFVYISGMLLGIFLISVFKPILPCEDWVVTCLVLPLTTIWNFIFVYKVLGGKNVLKNGDNLSGKNGRKKIINTSLIIL